MIDLATLESSVFTPLVGQSMIIRSGDKSATLEVVDVSIHHHKFPGSTREGFTISFRGQQGLRIPQAIYSLEHPGVGVMDVFITQTGDGPKGSEFESVFT
ncbi:DUF6916 family protein [Brevifollis gellanilyticus]|uniref:DUF6916 domain-containing protein n=1 Tax=Brevifollis gellanilyticus TaxID=748831 RepID=A0A512M7E5_9BACT|nr:hypothetical protein [Brevifollis gellanilyticus]GEP42657.1 hypothetical protein BGE01nite_19480 [Brevifollis gellanilyticus]